MNRRNRISLYLGVALVALLAGACKEDKSAGAAGPGPAPQSQRQATTANRVAVTVDGQGYHPASVSAPAGQPAQIEFTRTTDQTCGKEVVFPSLNIRRDLPLNRPVAVDVTMPASGSLAFTCGMDMYRGAIVAQ